MSSETVRRAITAIVLAMPAAAAVIAGPPYLTVFVAAIAAVMGWEWLHMTGRLARSVAGSTMLALLVGSVALATAGHFPWAFALIAAGTIAVFVAARWQRPQHAAAAAWGVIYIGVPALALLWLYGRPGIGRELVVWLIVIVIAADVAAYFAGRALRGPKLAPRISPGKTWSGALGGIAGAVVIGIALGLALELARPIVLAVAAAVFAIISQIGDLMESGLKRAFRVKDASGILPGHGGMMDRVDGIVAVLAAAALAIWIGGGDVRPWL